MMRATRARLRSLPWPSPAWRRWICLRSPRCRPLLPRDWNRDPGRTFPTVWHLDGMRARDDWNGWVLETNIERYYADKNVIVVMPVGGESSFYTNWNEPDNGPDVASCDPARWAGGSSPAGPPTGPGARRHGQGEIRRKRR